MGHTSARPCKACGHQQRVTTIQVQSTHGRLVMHSCRVCTERWWEHDDAEVGFVQVRRLMPRSTGRWPVAPAA